MGKALMTAVLVAVNTRLGEDKAVLIFETDLFSEKLVKLRCEEAEVVLQSHRGVKIPKSALHIVDGVKGVFLFFRLRWKCLFLRDQEFTG